MPTIFWAGDSTCQQNTMETYPQTGIAQVFDRYTRRGEVTISDHAVNGRSTKSFLDEGRLVTIYDQMNEGDFLFIQFGHNDEKRQDATRFTEPEGEFRGNLQKFVNAARNKGAHPVFITPVCRGLCCEKDDPEYRHVAWARAMEKLAGELDVPCIPLTERSEALVGRLSPEERDGLYMCFGPGLYPNYPEGKEDRTHLRPEGAMRFGGLIAQELVKLGGIYAALIAPEAKAWLKKEE